MDLAQPILPFAQPLLICDGYEPAEAGKINLYGCFHTIRPPSYPHVHEQFCVATHLTGGLGSVTTFIDVRSATTGQLVFWTHPHEFQIPDRNIVVRLVNRLEGVPFPQPGVYFVELYCENTPIGDFRIRLAPSGDLDFEEQP